MDGKQISLSESNVSFTLSAQVFISRTEREPKQDLYNNLFVKNFPSNQFCEADLRKMFEPFGELLSVKIDESRAFGFVAF